MQVIILIHTPAKTSVELIVGVAVTTEVVRRHEVTAKEIYAQVGPKLEHILVGSINIGHRLYELCCERQVARIYFILVRIEIVEISRTSAERYSA